MGLKNIKTQVTALLSWYAFLHALTLLGILFLHFVLNIDMRILGEPGKLLEAYFLDFLGRDLALCLSPILWLGLRIATGSAHLLPWKG